MSKYLIEDTSLTDIADQLRLELDTTQTYNPEDMPLAIHLAASQGGGGGLPSGILIKEYTPTSYEADVTWAFETDAQSIVGAFLGCTNKLSASYATSTSRIVESASIAGCWGTNTAYGIAYGYATSGITANNNSVSGWSSNSQRGALNVSKTTKGFDVTWRSGTSYPGLLCPNQKYLIALFVQ